MSKQEDYDYDKEVLRQQESIRMSGETNMFDVQAVYEIAKEAGHDELADFLENMDTRDYIDMANQAAELGETINE